MFEVRVEFIRCMGNNRYIWFAHNYTPKYNIELGSYKSYKSKKLAIAAWKRFKIKYNIKETV